MMQVRPNREGEFYSNSSSVKITVKTYPSDIWDAERTDTYYWRLIRGNVSVVISDSMLRQHFTEVAR